MNLVIVFLLAVSSTRLASISNTASASIGDSNSAVEEQFKVLVTVAGIKGHCGKEVKITVAYKSEIFDLCEGDEITSKEQRVDPIVSIEYPFEFPKGQIAIGKSFDVYVEGPDGYSDCMTDKFSCKGARGSNA